MRFGNSTSATAASHRRASIASLVASCVVMASPVSTWSQDRPEEVILKVREAQLLANAALEDAVTPLGGILGKIGPSGGYAYQRHGFGYFSVSLGGTGLGFEITNPDYSKSEGLSQAETISGPMGAFYADVELGLFEGYRLDRADGLLGLDFLGRVGATIGDQDDLANKIQLNRMAPIYGLGLRLGLVRGDGLPAVSLSVGFNDFTERTFTVKGDDTVGGAVEDFEVRLDFRQTGSFFVGEVAKRWKWVVFQAGGGIAWQRFEARYDTEVVHEGGKSHISNTLEFRKNGGISFAGVEVGAEIFRVVFEGGTASGEPYGSMFFRLTPLGGF